MEQVQKQLYLLDLLRYKNMRTRTLSQGGQTSTPLHSLSTSRSRELRASDQTPERRLFLMEINAAQEGGC
jgi:hypothetical protein